LITVVFVQNFRIEKFVFEVSEQNII